MALRGDMDTELEGAVSGRLEIRVLPQAGKHFILLIYPNQIQLKLYINTTKIYHILPISIKNM